MVRELNKIDPYYYSDCSDVVKDYIKHLEDFIENSIGLQPIDERFKRIPRFKISPEGWNMLAMDSLVYGDLPVNNTLFLEALIRGPRVFKYNKNKYDYKTIIFLMHVSTLDTFRFEVVAKFFDDSEIFMLKKHAFINGLLEKGYIDYNEMGKIKSRLVKHYFITKEGKDVITSFLGDVFSKPIKINFYDKNFKWDIRPAEGLRRTKQNISERYDTVFGITVPKRPTREKPWLRRSGGPRRKKRVKSTDR